MQDVIKINDHLSVARFAPDRAELQQAAREGFRSVVNMREADEKHELEPEEERRVAEEAGLTFLHHPVAGDSLSDEVVDDFRRKVSKLPSPVLVHCASGKRSGAMVMMHVAVEQGRPAACPDRQA